MTYVIAYVAVLIVFGMIDAVWLTTMGATMAMAAAGRSATRLRAICGLQG